VNNVSVAALIVGVIPVPPTFNTCAKYAAASASKDIGGVELGVGVRVGVLVFVGVGVLVFVGVGVLVFVGV
jgi:hypothetical protein